MEDREAEWETSDRSMRIAGLIVILLGIIVVGFVALAATLDSPKTVTTKDTVPVTIPLSPLPTIPEVVTPATTETVALRVDPPTTLPPTAADICNSLVYDFEEMLNPMICLYAVLVEQGVSQAEIDYADSWFFDVIAKESGGCPFLIGGDRDLPVLCIPLHHGHESDTGFGQATYSYYGPTGKLCTVYGVCSRAQILESPYTSMLYSVVDVAILDGRYGYCDYKGAPRYHNCNLVTKDWRLHATA